MIIELPDNVRNIITRLNTAGYEAYAVGGCVRDSVLGREPQDWDITTSALPEEVKELFNRTVDTGIKHGTVTVLLGRESYEVTTYRIDGKYSDSRHPDSVSFTRSLEEDLKRRDFTINAMAYGSDGLVDMFDGAGDIEKGVIRCVGNAEALFGEDALRILRAVRFSAQLGFDIERETMAAAAKLAPRLADISAERVHAELNKLLLSDHPERLITLHELGIDRVIMPEINEIAEKGELPKVCSLIGRSPANICLRWALLLAAVRRSRDPKEALRRLKFDNNGTYTICSLVRLTDAPLLGIGEQSMRRLINNAGRDLMELFFMYRMAADPDSDYNAAYELYTGIIERGDCTGIDMLAVNGRDLMELGIPAGKDIGRILSELLDRVLDDPALNTRESLLPIAKEAAGL